MTRLKTFAVLALAVGAAGTFVTCERRRLAALETRQRALATTVEDAARAADAARARADQLAHLARTRPPAPTAPPVAATEEPAGPDDDGATATTATAPAPPSPAVYAATLATTFADETADPSWGERARTTVADRLAARGDRSLRAIECRATACRLVTDALDVEPARQQIFAAMGGPGDEVWSGAYFSQLEDDAAGQPVRVTYLFRSGTALPML